MKDYLQKLKKKLYDQRRKLQKKSTRLANSAQNKKMKDFLCSSSGCSLKHFRAVANLTVNY